jgi:hypothetical protein
VGASPAISRLTAESFTSRWKTRRLRMDILPS